MGVRISLLSVPVTRLVCYPGAGAFLNFSWLVFSWSYKCKKNNEQSGDGLKTDSPRQGRCPQEAKRRGGQSI